MSRSSRRGSFLICATSKPAQMLLWRSQRCVYNNVATFLATNLTALCQSDFLELLFKHNCIRTQKKQKVFYWFSVPHDRLFLDALDRDLKREKLGLDTTTQAVAEPALSFAYNPSKSLYEQFAKATSDTPSSNDSGQPTQAVGISATAASGSGSTATKRPRPLDTRPSAVSDSLLGAFSLFEGSPTYKQRRKTSGITNRKPTSALSRIARAPSQCSRSSNDAQHRQPSYSQSPVPEPSPHFGTSLPTSLPRHLYISSPASAPSAYYIQPQNSTGHLASAISRSPVLPTESFATMTSHLSTSL